MNVNVIDTADILQTSRDAVGDCERAATWARDGFAITAVAVDGSTNYQVHHFIDATRNPDHVQGIISEASHHYVTHRREQQRDLLCAIDPARTPTNDDLDHATPARIVPGIMLGTAGFIGLQVRVAALPRFTAAFGDLAGVPAVGAGWCDDESPHAVILLYRRSTPLHDLNDDAMSAWGDDIELIYGEHRPLPIPGCTWSHPRNAESVWRYTQLQPQQLRNAPPLPDSIEALLTNCDAFTRDQRCDAATRATIHRHANIGNDRIAALLDALCNPSAGIGLTHATIQRDDTILLGLPGGNGPTGALIVGKHGAPELECWTDAHPRLKRGHRYGIVHGAFTDLTAAAAPTTIAATVAGGTFVFDDAHSDDWWWGNGDDILAMRGETLVIAANTGVGKTTLAALIMSAWIGARSDALGCQVRGDGRRVLYLAMDRPKQSARALRRIFTDDDRDLLDTSLIVRKGPPPAQITADPTVWATLANQHGAGLVIVDGLKDATSELNGDEAGLAANQAMQAVIAAGCELIVLHHLRIGVGGGKPSLDDLYGSTWIPSGAGSVIVLQGVAGGDRVKLHHLKSPVDAAGPWDIALNPATGTMARVRSDDLARIIESCGRDGADARQVAYAIYGSNPTDAMVQRVNRDLGKRAERGDFIVKHGKRGGKGGSTASRYFATLGSDPFMGESNTGVR